MFVEEDYSRFDEKSFTFWRFASPKEKRLLVFHMPNEKLASLFHNSKQMRSLKAADVDAVYILDSLFWFFMITYLD